jgi:hypothetical protein
MRVATVALCTMLAAGSATARCAPFNLVASTGKVPFIVHGKVARSNKEELRSAQCGPKACTHRFSVDVIDWVKGKGDPATLRFEYDYVVQRPEIALFAEGDEYVFAVRSIDARGQAALFGTTCGRSGVEVAELDRIKRAAGSK